MKTDDLIEALSRNLEPATPPPGPLRYALVAIAGLGLGVALLLLMPNLGFRNDLMLNLPAALTKAGFSALAASAAAPVLMRLARPGRPLGWRLLAAFGFFALCALIACIALLGTDPGGRLQAWTGGGFPWCLVLIPTLAAPAALALGWFVRGLAPTNLTGAGAAVGAVSGGLGAMVYAMSCPVDSVAFVATWYALAIALCAALGALAGAWLLRW